MRKCVNNYHDTRGRISGEPSSVYLTTLKENLYVCPTVKCRYVSSYENVEMHLKTHVFQQEVEEILSKIQKMSLELPSHVDLTFARPVKYFHHTWRSTSCEYCEEVVKTAANASSHRMLCRSNPRPTFPCTQPNCDQLSASYDDFQKHLRYHARIDERKAANHPHTCKYCEQGFSSLKAWRRHQSECAKNPNPPPTYECPWCKKQFKRNDNDAYKQRQARVRRKK